MNNLPLVPMRDGFEFVLINVRFPGWLVFSTKTNTSEHQITYFSLFFFLL